jgi:hypothetical protein
MCSGVVCSGEMDAMQWSSGCSGVVVLCYAEEPWMQWSRSIRVVVKWSRAPKCREQWMQCREQWMNHKIFLHQT